MHRILLTDIPKPRFHPGKGDFYILLFLRRYHQYKTLIRTDTSINFCGVFSC